MQILNQLGLKENSMQGEVVLLTGGARGIGAATAEVLHYLGATVVIADISVSGDAHVQHLRKKGGDFYFYQTDMSDLLSIDQLVAFCTNQFGKVDAIVSAAARLKVGSVMDLPIDSWDDSYSTNMRGPAYLIKSLIPGMLKRKHGAILPLISLEGLPYMGSYSAQKMGLRSLVVTLGREIPSGSGVSCMALVPGSVDTPLIHEIVAAIAENLGVPSSEVMNQIKNNPGYDGLVPAEHTAASIAYFLNHAEKYHGQFVDGYGPLKEHGIITIPNEDGLSMTHGDNFDYGQIPNPEIELKQLVSRNQELEARIHHRTMELEAALTMIRHSIDYASRIQKAQLPNVAQIKNKFADFEVYWSPRDQIGGDFWWVSPVDETGKFSIVAVDCTGHGVPGAMLALLVSNLMVRIYDQPNEPEPKAVLIMLDKLLRSGLHQDSESSTGDDGCDAAVVQIDPVSQEVIYAGSGIDLYVLDHLGNPTRYSGSSQSLGYRNPPKKLPVQISIRMEPDQIFVITSDGIIDQVGSLSNGKKASFGSSRFKTSLQDAKGNGCSYLVKQVIDDMKKWQGNETIRDDLMLLAFSPIIR